VPDATAIELYVDDEPLDPATARKLEYERVLDMRTGLLTRDLLWSTPSGQRVRIRTCLRDLPHDGGRASDGNDSRRAASSLGATARHRRAFRGE